MKRLCLICVSLYIGLLSFAQDFPYCKILNYSSTQFKEAKFKYDSYYNQWKFQKINGWNETANILNALAGMESDIKPDERDYFIIVQMGENNQIAWIQVVFYQTSTYHDILTFAADKGSNNLETNSGKMTKLQFNYDNYSFSMVRNLFEVKTTSTNTSAAAKTKDNSYNQYVYTIYTGVTEESLYLKKQAEKQEKRDAKGKNKTM
ncbi:MAG: hypothetical protein MJ198_02455 [Bacteroidales bacterium]|nr:hypothetical protein [Bacteroidales bacterium]